LIKTSFIPAEIASSETSSLAKAVNAIIGTAIPLFLINRVVSNPFDKWHIDIHQYNIKILFL